MITKLETRKLYSAIENNEIESVIELIEEFPELLNFDIKPFGSPLHIAASENKTDICRMLLEKGADVNANGGALGGNALNEAAHHSVELCNLFFDYGARIDISGPKVNPLFSAIFSGSLPVVKLLIEKGIDFSVKYSGDYMENMDATAFAHERGQWVIRDYLLSLR